MKKLQKVVSFIDGKLHPLQFAYQAGKGVEHHNQNNALSEES